MKRIRLIPFPGMPAPAVHSFEASLERSREGALQLAFDLRADPAQLRWPGPRTTTFRDGLWRHTCMELFAAPVGNTYREFNFSPSGEYAIYNFSGYRAGMHPVTPPVAPHIHVAADEAGWAVEIRVPEGLLICPDGTVQLMGIAAVLEDAQGSLSFWAAQHAPEKPDFHHRAGLVIPWPDGPLTSSP